MSEANSGDPELAAAVTMGLGVWHDEDQVNIDEGEFPPKIGEAMRAQSAVGWE